MMSTLTPFRIQVATLLRRPGASRVEHVEAPLADLGSAGAEVPTTSPVVADVTLERVSDGIVVRGTVTAHWTASCSRCLSPVEGGLAVHVDELYERDALEGETYALDDDVLDLEPLVRDAVMLELPNAPRCRESCSGLCPTCGADRNAAPCNCTLDDADPRWAPLRALEL